MAIKLHPCGLGDTCLMEFVEFWVPSASHSSWLSRSCDLLIDHLQHARECITGFPHLVAATLSRA